MPNSPISYKGWKMMHVSLPYHTDWRGWGYWLWGLDIWIEDFPLVKALATVALVLWWVL